MGFHNIQTNSPRYTGWEFKVKTKIGTELSYGHFERIPFIDDFREQFLDLWALEKVGFVNFRNLFLNVILGLASKRK